MLVKLGDFLLTQNKHLYIYDLSEVASKEKVERMNQSKFTYLTVNLVSLFSRNANSANFGLVTAKFRL